MADNAKKEALTEYEEVVEVEEKAEEVEVEVETQRNQKSTAADDASKITELVEDDEAIMFATLDKSVCMHDTLEDLQKALTYEAVFSSLIEQKLLAIKRDCDERKRLKRMKRKSIGRILFSKKLFGSGSRKSSALDAGNEREGSVQHSETPQLSGHATTLRSDAIEAASPSLSQIQRAKLKTPAAAAAAAAASTSACGLETPMAADDSLTSTFSNDNPSYSSADRNSSAAAAAAVAVKRSLLVKAQTHAPSTEAVASSSSGDSRGDIATPPTASDGVVPPPPPPPLTASLNDVNSFASAGNGGIGHLHTSTMAEGSLTSMRDDSIESLSFASSRCTVSFGATEIIPDDTASLLYERARVVKRLRILEAKSISAQCSPILPRHVFKAVPTRAPAITTTTPNAVPAPTLGVVAATVFDDSTQLQRQQRFLQGQASYTDSVYAQRIRADSEAATCFFSRQNTSEDSANLTVSTLLNEGDSLSLHVPFVCSPISCADADAGVTAQTILLSPGERYKSKSTSLLASRQTASGPTPSTPLLNELEQLHVSGQISNNGRLVVSTRNPKSNLDSLVARKDETLKVSEPTEPTYGMQSSQPPSHYIPALASTMVATITSTTTKYADGFAAAVTATNGTANGTMANGGANGVVIVPHSNLSGDTAKLHRMTSTSTGSSVAPTGCCATKTKSSSRDKEKQRFRPRWPSGQTGSDDEYRRRKRKYKRYHRCSDPVLVYPSPSGLQHCILSMPPNDPTQFHFNEDFTYDMQLPVECDDKTDDLQEIVPSHRHRKHRHHKHKKRHRHKKRKLLVHDLDTQVVKVIDPDDLPQKARWTIIATACLLLLMCLMLVGITLRMAPIIDDMGARAPVGPEFHTTINRIFCLAYKLDGSD